MRTSIAISLYRLVRLAQLSLLLFIMNYDCLNIERTIIVKTDFILEQI